MENSEDILVDINTAWEGEVKRVENLREKRTFGYRYIMEALDDIIISLSNRQHISGYIQLGELRQKILTSTQFINEE